METCVHYLLDCSNAAAAATATATESGGADTVGAEALTLDTSKQLLKALEERAQQSKNSDTYTKAQTQAVEAQRKIDALLSGVDGLQSMLGDEETGIRHRLVQAKQQKEQVEEQLSENTKVLECLRLLAQIRELLRQADIGASISEETGLEAAARAVTTAESLLEGAVSQVGQSLIRAAVAERLVERRKAIGHLAAQRLEWIVCLHSDPAHATVQAVQLDGGPGDLFAAVEALGSQEALQQQFGEYFLTRFIDPVLASPRLTLNASASSDTRLVVDMTPGSNSNNNTKSSAKSVDESSSESDAAVVCETLLGAIDVISRALGSRCIWSADTLTALCTRVVRRSVLCRMPSTGAQLEEYARSTGPVLRDFESRLQGLLQPNSSRDPPLSSPSAAASEWPIAQALGTLNQLYVRERYALALSQARDIAEAADFSLYDFGGDSQQWNSQLVQALAGEAGVNVSPDLLQSVQHRTDKPVADNDADLPDISCPAFPQCAVSQASHKLVSLGYALVCDQVPSDGSTELSAHVPQVFAAFRLLFPSVHRAELQRVPALGWQHHNDCLYVAHHLALMGRLASSTEASTALAAEAQRFLCAAEQQRRGLVEQQALEMRAQALGGSPLIFTDACAAATKLKAAVRQVGATARQLGRALRPPTTTAHVYRSAMAQGLDAVFAATVQAVLDVRDIGVAESQTLSDHCRAILGLSETLVLQSPQDRDASHTSKPSDALDSLLMLQDDGDQQRGDEAHMLAEKYCAYHADRLEQLADVLVISRKDILARRRAGLLRNFSVDELQRLIRALFSDTPERAQDIEALATL
ncbi:Centromere/kinetochore protein zw10 [Coemansia sp. Benny D115]|nr:Centromere/kinetochore protein zw10 [Coemansia sp. Benny D115]